MDLQELGALVREERKRAGLSTQVLADRAGVDRTTLSKLENQRLSELGFAKLSRLLGVLELTFSVQPASGLPTLNDLRREQRRESP